MELTGKLKEDVAKCETRDDAKNKIEEAGIVLNDEELDSVAGGYWVRKPKPNPSDIETRRRLF
ncbi:MAG: hypothetical protein K6E51_08125 [Treponema sp.]|nr:hypothetical protein [Treponema sp.]